MISMYYLSFHWSLYALSGSLGLTFCLSSKLATVRNALPTDTLAMNRCKLSLKWEMVWVFVKWGHPSAVSGWFGADTRPSVLSSRLRDGTCRLCSDSLLFILSAGFSSSVFSLTTSAVIVTRGAFTGCITPFRLYLLPALDERIALPLGTRGVISSQSLRYALFSTPFSPAGSNMTCLSRPGKLAGKLTDLGGGLSTVVLFVLVLNRLLLWLSWLFRLKPFSSISRFVWPGKLSEPRLRKRLLLRGVTTPLQNKDIRSRRGLNIK